MEHTLNLIVNNEVNLGFLKANSALLNKFKIDNTDGLIHAWKKEYNIDLILPDCLKFHNENDLTMFLIKWG
jgi:hypothetical protein